MPGGIQPDARREARAGARLELIRCSFHHFLTDGFSWTLYPLLPLIAAEFDLGYGSVGAIKTSLNVLLAALGVPFGLLAERVGEVAVLTLGSTTYGLGLALAGLAWSYPVFLVMIILAGAGGGASHPIGSSLVSRSSPGMKSGTAMGILNFSGDVGKAVLPAAAGLVAWFLGWRACLIIFGLTGAAVVLVLGRLGRSQDRPRARPDPQESSEQPGGEATEPADGSAWGVRSWPAFISLHLVGILDSMPRSSVAVFAPFLLVGMGMEAAHAGAYLSLLAAGGALGKLFCGPLADYLGKRKAVILTEILTGAGMVAFVVAGRPWIAPILFGLGIFLNGTSSILYALVSRVTTPARRSRGFGLYYTVTLAASGLSPLLLGAVADLIGLVPVFYVMAAALLLTIPLTWSLEDTGGRVGAEGREMS